MVNRRHRNTAIQLLIKLQKIRNYNTYTLFQSISIFDRYLRKIGHWNIEKSDIDYIVCQSCFIAAKVEQSKKPKIDNLIYDYRALT